MTKRKSKPQSEPNPPMPELPMPRQITNLHDLRETALSGDVRLVLKSLSTNKSLAYRIKRSEDNPYIYFVSIWTEDLYYLYIGIIRDNDFGLTKRSKLDAMDEPVKAFRFFWENVMERNQIHPKLEVWQEPVNAP